MPGASLEETIEFCANARRVTSKENASGLAVLEDLIRRSHGLGIEEFERRVREKLAGAPQFDPVEMRRAWEAVERGSLTVLKEAAALLKFCVSNPGIRRWLVSRVYKTAQKALEFQAFLDLHYAPATERLLAELGIRVTDPVSEIESRLLQLPADRLEFWGKENFDLMAHLPQEEFREILKTCSSYSADRIEEGMVFVEISQAEVRFVQFTVQARRQSESIFRALMREEEGSKGAPR